MKGRRNKSDTVCTNDEVSLILKLDKVELGETNIFSLGNLENSFVSSKYYPHSHAFWIYLLRKMILHMITKQARKIYIQELS